MSQPFKLESKFFPLPEVFFSFFYNFGFFLLLRQELRLLFLSNDFFRKVLVIIPPTINESAAVIIKINVSSITYQF